MADIGRCRTCKHWSPDRYLEEAPIEARRCTRIPEWFEATGWNEDGDFVVRGDLTGILAFANDGSGYHAQLLTLPEFGCVMHETHAAP